MDLESIERALRAGPVDEPVYVPDSFRRSPGGIWSLAAVTGVLAVTLVVGAAAGYALSMLRGTGDGPGAPNASALAASLEGRWVSQQITRQDWIDALAALGHQMDEVNAFLLHDPIASRTRYELRFLEDHLQVFEAADSTPFQGEAGGPYQVMATGAVLYDDIGCFVTATFDITGDRLSFEPISTESCDAEERIANTAFFNLVDYTRAGSD